MATHNDFSLVAQVALSGNRRAFDELVRRYQSSVRRFFLHQTLGDSQLSDDLAQDTFLKAYTSIASFHGLSSFQTWLMRIAYNVFYDHVRKNQTTHPRPLPIREGSSYSIDEDSTDRTIYSPPPQGGAGGDSLSVALDIHTALSLLKADERSCITLQLIDGYDIAAIAKITGMKEGTVKSHLSRGKEKLATYLRKHGYDGR